MNFVTMWFLAWITCKWFYIHDDMIEEE